MDSLQRINDAQLLLQAYGREDEAAELNVVKRELYELVQAARLVALHGTDRTDSHARRLDDALAKWPATPNMIDALDARR
jgi:hypothetical protein